MMNDYDIINNILFTFKLKQNFISQNLIKKTHLHPFAETPLN